MARTKKTPRTGSGAKKTAKPTKTIQVEAEIHTPIASATDQDSLDEEEAPLPDLKSPTVSLVGLAPSTSTPKLTGGKPRCPPEIEVIDQSEDSTIADTPKTSRGTYESLPSSREQPTSKRRRRCETYVFSDEQESELSEWYQLHPIFYDKTEQHYKNAAKKNCLLEEKGMCMDPPCTCKYHSFI